LRIIQLLREEPATGTEILNYLKDKLNSTNRNSNSARLSMLYRDGYIIRSKATVGPFGFIYALPGDEERIKPKLFKVTPESVKKTISLLADGRSLSFQELHEECGLNFDEFELWIKQTLRRWGLAWTTRYRGFTIVHRADVQPDFAQFDKRISDVHAKTREQGLEFEHQVKDKLKLLTEQLNKQGHIAEYIHTVGNSRGQWIDGEVRVKLFGKIGTIRLLVEIKSYVCQVNQIIEFLHKIRDFEGLIVPVMIAHAFTGDCYKYFPSKVLLLRAQDVEKMAEIIHVGTRSHE